jgi:hypothetical protein
MNYVDFIGWRCQSDKIEQTMGFITIQKARVWPIFSANEISELSLPKLILETKF